MGHEKRWQNGQGGWSYFWRYINKKVVREKLVLATLPTLSLQIVEFAREHGRITIGEATKLTGASRNTLKQHFHALVERGHLNQHGSGRGVWYELRQVSLSKVGSPLLGFTECVIARTY